MRSYLQSKTVKMAMSATISVIIANKLGLQFGVTAGIIAILSILNTKKEALRVGGRRFIAATIAILLSFFLYKLLGNSPLIFGLFLLVFISITIKLKVEEGMVVGSVLSTHLLVSSNIDIYWVYNEFAIAIIGIGVSLIFNLYAPSLEDKFERNREKIEDQFRVILSDMSVSLVNHTISIYDKEIMDNVEELIKETREIAHKISENSLFKIECYSIKYIGMRMIQLDTIKRMKKHFSRFYMKYEQAIALSEFTKNVAVNIREDNDCVELIKQLDLLKEDYKNMELPKTRAEFENRALLFQFLNDLEEFLTIKKEFKEDMSCKI
ncbi:aromatic acid exporter family protein [Clostridium paraputrificum]|uniref:aromatic acid exporter family protein n=1 Tax=Clostridium TaxID=1485 RepID=UPI003D34CED9